ncbi:MAG: shikimate kinase, partial [bacterium]
LDAEIEAACGADIPWIFDVEGEAGFRKRESAMLDALSNEQGIVLATGGGAVIAPENRTALAARGTVVYLSATADQLYERTRRDSRRPLLQVADPKEAIRSILAQREPLYREIADIVVETGRKQPAAVATVIIDMLDNLRR